MMRPGYAVMFDVTDAQRDELARKQIRSVELRPAIAPRAGRVAGKPGRRSPRPDPQGTSGVKPVQVAPAATAPAAPCPRRPTL